MVFKLYKGIKKPLVLFGLKDKYIYQAMALILLGVIVAGGLNSFFGFYAVISGFIIAGGGVWFIFYLQDKRGLYNKNKSKKELLIIPKRIRKRQ